jgi:DNA-binding transcriptional ArsR family regulator
MKGLGFQERIIRLLEKHKYGLTIEEVSRFLGINRMTASRHLAVLEAGGKVLIREVGKAKLHYPKNRETERWLK